MSSSRNSLCMMAFLLCPATYVRFVGNLFSTNSNDGGSYYILTGDIGGTNSRMSLYEGSSTDEPTVVKYYRNQDAFLDVKIDPNDPSIFCERVLIPFLEYCFKSRQQLLPGSPIICCLATAGVVSHNRVNMTNLQNLLVDGYYVETSEDSYLKHIQSCRVINDFVAQGYGCLTLTADEMVHLAGPKELNEGVKVCVGAGTGLGECFLTPTGASTYACFPSEGGHVEYAPSNDLQVQLWKYLTNKFDINRISVERVVSGKGLANVYEFLAHQFPERKVDKVHKQFLDAGDQQGRVVATNAKPQSLCLEALTLMMSTYGGEVGSAAIKWIPTGGLFVTGGLTPKNMKHIEGKDSAFLRSYHNKGRVSSILERVPLYAVQVEDLGVRGVHKAAVLALDEYLGTVQEGKESISHGWVSMVLAAAAGAAVGAMVTQRRT